MSLNDEERWSILKEIKTSAIGNNTQYRVVYDGTLEATTRGQDVKTFFSQLEDKGYVRIYFVEEGPEEYLVLYERYILILQKPKFNEIYQIYEKKFGPNLDIALWDSLIENGSAGNHLSEQPLYQLRFENGILTLNSKWKLAKPDFNSENYNLIDEVMKKESKLTLSDFKKLIGGDPRKSFHQILNDLGFKSELKKVFFPNISKDALIFRNSVTAEMLKNAEIDEDKLNIQIKELLEI